MKTIHKLLGVALALFLLNAMSFAEEDIPTPPPAPVTPPPPTPPPSEDDPATFAELTLPQMYALRNYCLAHGYTVPLGLVLAINYREDGPPGQELER